MEIGDIFWDTNPGYVIDWLIRPNFIDLIDESVEIALKNPRRFVKLVELIHDNGDVIFENKVWVSADSPERRWLTGIDRPLI